MDCMLLLARLHIV